MNNLRGSMGLTEMKNARKTPTTIDNFQQAVNLGKNAAPLTRIAKTKAEWYQVGIEWQRTIEILKKDQNLVLIRPLAEFILCYN